MVHPSLHIDEGYYLGATRAILGGDLLLRTYSFDKPFLVALWPIPGVLLFGMNSIGFRLMAWLSYGVSFVLFARVLQKELVSRILSLLVAGVLFAVPTFFVHGVSNFCEPILILCSVLLLYGLSSGASVVFLSRVFFLGVFTKYSFFLYLPLLFPAIARVGIRAFFKPSIPFFAIGLLYSVANPIKFGSLTWFSHFVLDKHQDPFLVRTWNRMFEIFYSLDSVVLSALLMSGAVGWWIRKNPALRSEALLLPGVVVLHFLIYLFMGANFYPRYVVQSLPAVFLLAVRGLVALRGGGFRANLVDPALVIALVPLLISIARVDREPVELDLGLGRELQLYGALANHEGAWVQNAYLWQTAPFSGKSTNTGCVEAACSGRFRAAHPLFEKGYRIAEGKLRRLPLWTGAGERLIREEIWLKANASGVSAQVLEALRLKKTYEVVRLEIEPQQTPESGSIFLPKGIRLLARPLPGKSSLLPEIEIRFTPGIHEFHRGSEFPRPVYQVLARVEDLRIAGKDVLDGVMPLFFGGYSIPLEILPFVYDPSVRYSPLEVRSEGIRILKESVRPSSG
jgi:4-amino-4-deoxy-L-arabinose transferase-like glycosyltransferase